tara:strand:- start:276 stop:1043 length:768 start_codon:yes stop_codon:yes gene_type:complete
MISRNKILKTVKPDIIHTFAGASGGNDILFNWVPIEIPVGCVELRSLFFTLIGINGSTGNNSDIELYFAKGINSVAPADLTAHAASSTAIAATFRRNLIGFFAIDASETMLNGDTTYNTYQAGGKADGGDYVGDGGFTVFLEGEPHVTRTGFQTIYMMATAHGAAQDYGTDVLLNMGSNQAASTAAVQITTDGTDPRNVFQPGDIVIGHTGTVEMEVVSVDSATTMTVKDVSAQIDDDEHLILKNPIELRLGLEY